MTPGIVCKAFPNRLLMAVWLGLLQAVAAMNVAGQEASSTEETLPYSTLHEAAEAGDKEAAQAFMDRGAEIDARHGGRHETPLLAALNANQMDMAAFLLDQGADPRVKDRFDNTALHLAARFGDPEMMRRLVDLGVNVDARNNLSKTALHIAAERRRVAAIRILAEGGADLDALDPSGRAPIDYALKHADPKPARALVEAGASIVASETTALSRTEMAAAKGWNFAVERALQEAQAVGAEDLRSRLVEQAFERAFTNMDRELIDYLIAQGARLDTEAPGGLSRLHLAAELDGRQLVKELADRGLDPLARIQPSGWTALHLAAVSASPDTVAEFIDSGVDVNARDALNRTALHLAAWSENAGAASTLLRRNADVNAADSFGNTPLHYAAQQGSPAVVRTLLVNGASRGAVNAHGDTPLEYARRAGHMRVIERLRHREPETVERPPYFGPVAQRIEQDVASRIRGTVRQRLDKGLRQEFPLIHLAIQERSPSAVSFLLGRSSDAARERDPFGFQPLHAAAGSGAAGLVNLLVDAGAPVNDQENTARWTPLHFAAASDHDGVVRMLIDHGADPTLSDGAGRTPADVAEWAGAEAVLSVLRGAE